MDKKPISSNDSNSRTSKQVSASKPQEGKLSSTNPSSVSAGRTVSSKSKEEKSLLGGLWESTKNIASKLVGNDPSISGREVEQKPMDSKAAKTKNYAELLSESKQKLQDYEKAGWNDNSESTFQNLRDGLLCFKKAIRLTPELDTQEAKTILGASATLDPANQSARAHNSIATGQPVANLELGTVKSLINKVKKYIDTAGQFDGNARDNMKVLEQTLLNLAKSLIDSGEKESNLNMARTGQELLKELKNIAPEYQVPSNDPDGRHVSSFYKAGITVEIQKSEVVLKKLDKESLERKEKMRLEEAERLKAMPTAYDKVKSTIQEFKNLNSVKVEDFQKLNKAIEEYEKSSTSEEYSKLLHELKDLNLERNQKVIECSIQDFEKTSKQLTALGMTKLRDNFLMKQFYARKSIESKAEIIQKFGRSISDQSVKDELKDHVIKVLGDLPKSLILKSLSSSVDVKEIVDGKTKDFDLAKTILKFIDIEEKAKHLKDLEFKKFLLVVYSKGDIEKASEVLVANFQDQEKDAQNRAKQYSEWIKNINLESDSDIVPPVKEKIKMSIVRDVSIYEARNTGKEREFGAFLANAIDDLGESILKGDPKVFLRAYLEGLSNALKASTPLTPIRENLNRITKLCLSELQKDPNLYIHMEGFFQAYAARLKEINIRELKSFTKVIAEGLTFNSFQYNKDKTKKWDKNFIIEVDNVNKFLGGISQLLGKEKDKDAKDKESWLTVLKMPYRFVGNLCDRVLQKNKDITKEEKVNLEWHMLKSFYTAASQGSKMALQSFAWRTDQPEELNQLMNTTFKNDLSMQARIQGIKMARGISGFFRSIPSFFERITSGGYDKIENK